MEVVGKSTVHIVLDSCLHESTIYFSDHEKLLKCNPYCSNVKYHVDLDIFQWVFQVNDPRNNPITAVFFVRQHEESITVDDSYGQKFVSRLKPGIHLDGKGKRIRWEAVHDYPEFDAVGPNTFIGKASSEICLLHHKDNRTSVFFDTDIALDFEISFPLNLMPEGILKFMSDAIMSQIMQQATESMLCQVQSDICCTSAESVVAGAGK
ncbi:DUF1997 domain-containing protein [Chlorobium sp. BLA1]|uniref:DUF1997 domain-containing protein n=1 Tax=Candidatus Chlorobium masyuteum TaxID=2716876 RepID=UPI001420A954|nr:DUF1997 domain-containing protein [Candidatus Chlorobium masyuteum]NHQ59777.1 DUF1997 domain-containing protein [Candidatus Chlorobium masyuteum]NTU44942.1 DUF1997 domain-containing protein [Chlorobiaceae bacterium]